MNKIEIDILSKNISSAKMLEIVANYRAMQQNY